MFDVIVLDLDGTLLKNDKSISTETLTAIKRHENLGKQVVIATARPPRLGDIKLPKELEKEFMIFYNGAEIYHSREKIYSKCISAEALYEIRILLLNKYKGCKVCFEVDNKLYSNFDVKDIFGNVQFKKIDLQSFNFRTVTKILIDPTSIENIDEFKVSLPNGCHLVITDKGTLGQIMADGVNKLNALKYIINKLETSIDKVMFFGDDINDIELIKECGIGIAMGNAESVVKEAADYITKSNEENGIAEFLNSLLE